MSSGTESRCRQHERWDREQMHAAGARSTSGGTRSISSEQKAGTRSMSSGTKAGARNTSSGPQSRCIGSK
eukprot:1161761-Pelagomonas_calceolata.AAC.8